MEKVNLDSNMNVEKKSLPNATATLVLGILSIVSCFCYGLPGFILSIIALAISGKSVQMYKENPDAWLDYGNLKAGRIMAIIGLCLSGVLVLVLVLYIVLIGGIAAFSITEVFNELNGF